GFDVVGSVFSLDRSSETFLVVSALFNFDIDGAGTTPVMPSGSFPTFSFSFERSPAPPALGLKALYAVAAFRNVFATSRFDFFFIIGPRPGRNCSASGD